MAGSATASVQSTTPPSALISVAGLVVGTDATITVRRSWAGQLAIVRAANAAPVTGASMPVVDWEAPIGVPVSYQLTVRNTSGAVTSQMATGAVTLTSTRPWISDPLAPRLSAQIGLLGDALGELGYVRAGDVLQPLGSRFPVAIAGTRMAAGGVALNIRCTTLADRDAVLGVLMSADPVCLRVPGDDPRYSMLPPLAYVTSDTVSQQPLNVAQGGTETRIVWTVQLVRAPASTIAAPVRTCADVLAEAATCGDLAAKYATCYSLLMGT